MHVIPQEFESVLQTSQRYKSGINCPPNEAWKLIASIDKLKGRAYLEGNEKVLGLLSQASKAYQTGLEISSNRSSYKATDVTRQFMQASEAVLNAFNAYSASKDVQVTNQNAVSTTPDLLSTANDIHEFMTPYYGDQSNKVKRCVRFVEKIDTMPVVYQEGAVTGSARPAQFGNGMEAWISFKKQPGTIWIIGRTGNAFNTNKDIIDFIRQYFPNLTFFNNTILFAREIGEWNNDVADSVPLDPPFDINYAKGYQVKKNAIQFDSLSAKAEKSATLSIVVRLKKISANLLAILQTGLSTTGYAAATVAIRTFIGLSSQFMNLLSRMRGDNYYAGDPSKHNFLIQQLTTAWDELGKLFSSQGDASIQIQRKSAEITKIVSQIVDICEKEYVASQTNMRAKSFLEHSLAAEAGTIKAEDYLSAIKVDAGSMIKYLAKAIIRGIGEIIGWTAINLTMLTFEVALSAITNGLHLIIQLWNKLRIALIERDARNNPDHDQTAFYEYIKYQDILEEKSHELEGISDHEFNRVAARFRKYLIGLGSIFGRCKKMLEDDILNDSSMTDPFGVDKYMRSYSSSIKGLEILKAKINSILSTIKRCVLIGLGAISKLADAVLDSGVIRYTVKTLLIAFVNLAKILNTVVAEGLDVADAMLHDKEIVTQTDKIVGILQNLSPKSVIDEQTVQNLKDMFDPVFAKLQFYYNHPDVALKNVMESLKGKQSTPMNMSNTSRPGGEVHIGRSGGAPAFASLMDSDSSKLIDTNMVGNADSEYGYVPSPLPLSLGV